MTFETEKGFMQAVIDLARVSGWKVYHTFDSRRSAAGYFDLTMMQNGYVIFSELKREGAKPTDSQVSWGEEANAIQDHIEEGYSPYVDPDDITCPVRYFLWRPSDWPEIERTLQRREHES